MLKAKCFLVTKYVVIWEKWSNKLLNDKIWSKIRPKEQQCHLISPYKGLIAFIMPKYGKNNTEILPGREL